MQEDEVYKVVPMNTREFLCPGCFLVSLKVTGCVNGCRDHG